MAGVDAVGISARSRLDARALPRAGERRRVMGGRAVLLVLLANAGLIVWLWVHGGNAAGLRDTGDVLTSLARITGLLGAYSALVQVLLLARIPPLERLVGLDRLTVWHRW